MSDFGTLFSFFVGATGLSAAFLFGRKSNQNSQENQLVFAGIALAFGVGALSIEGSLIELAQRPILLVGSLLGYWLFVKMLYGIGSDG